jgi:hypothetical protein
MAQGRYDGAILAIQTGLGVTRHLGRAPTILQVLVGAAAGSVMCGELEQFVQCENAPNLYGALDDLPWPRVEADRAIENETQAVLADITTRRCASRLKGN